MNKAISWFEIPAADLDRAQGFYETVFRKKLNRTSMGGEELAVFPYDRDGGATGGALIHSREAGKKGSTIYLFSEEPIEDVLARVPGAGGQIEKGRIELPNGIGAIGLIVDCEGNRVGVHAMK